MMMSRLDVDFVFEVNQSLGSLKDDRPIIVGLLVQPRCYLNKKSELNS